jgi:hypothetical protein
VALLLVGAGCHTTALSVRPDVWNDRQVFSLEAQSESNGPFLSQNNPGAGGATQYKAITDVTSGPVSLASSYTGSGASKPIVFASPPLAQNLYLNLSLPVFGELYWINTPSQASSKGVEASQVRVDVRIGAQRVGGEIFTANADYSQNQPGWIHMPLSFRPEVGFLAAGQSLTFEITRINGLADFTIATDGARQSFLEFRVLPFNPLAGNLYLENGRMIPSGPGAQSTSAFLAQVHAFRARGGIDHAPRGLVLLPSSHAAHPAAVALAGAGLLPLVGLFAGRMPHKRALLLVALLLAVGLSGCAGVGKKDADKGGDPNAPQPSVSQTFEPNQQLKDAGHGAVDGFIHDEVGIPVGRGHVSLLGTSNFGTTDSRGHFAFDNVSAGKFSLRVDADKYQPLEQQIEIKSGSITRLNVTLVFPVYKASNDKPHLHDYWGGADKLLLHEGDVAPRTEVASEYLSTASSWVCDGYSDEDAGGLKRKSCETVIPIDASAWLVPPGASSVEVVFKWAATGNMPKQVGLRVTTATNVTGAQQFVPRGPGEPFRVAIFPTEADPGHQKFTKWTFFLWVPATDLYHPFGAPLFSGGAFHATITAYKGVVPFEPAHRDFWGEQKELPIAFQNNPLTMSGEGCYPRRTAGTTDGWPLAKGFFVPPGTKEIRGTFKWSNTYLDALPTVQSRWKLAYLSAAGAWSSEPWTRATLTANGTNNYVFSITPKPTQVDQFYQVTSNWLFSPDSMDELQGRQDENSANYCGGTTSYTSFTLSAVAIKDPDFKDSSK